MAELTPKEKLQPSLLDRLTDDEPDRRKESRDKRILTGTQLRESVRRYLSWLLNNTWLQSVEDLDAYPEVAQSTLNYGCLLYTSPSPRDRTRSRMPSSA